MFIKILPTTEINIDKEVPQEFTINQFELAEEKPKSDITMISNENLAERRKFHLLALNRIERERDRRSRKNSESLL